MRPVGFRLFLIIAATIIFCGAVFSNEENTNGGMPLENLEKATFSGGCFWCMDPPFSKLKGVKEVIVGYTGGKTPDPTYEEVSSGTSGHFEAAEIVYDSSQVSYKKLLDVFWRNIDPTDPNGQFVDEGSQYRSAIFFHNEEQKRLADESKKALTTSGRFDKPIVTEIISVSTFYPAEDYHQDYHKICPLPYKSYRAGSGRDQFLDKIWGKDRSK